MRGMIRVVLGFFMVYGAVGSLDIDPTASELAMGALAVVGLALMASGLSAIQEK